MDLILEDFTDELNSKKQHFYFKEIALKTDGFKDALFEQFKELTTFPKYDLYLKDIPNYEDIVKAFHNEIYNPERLSKSNNTSIAKFVTMGKAEVVLNELANEFNKLVRDRKVETKYYGRNLLSTPLIQTLTAIDTSIKEFEKYVSKDITKDSYQTFGQAFANKLILLTDKLRFPTLKKAIINDFINENENLDINLSNIMKEYRYYNTDDLKSDYNILKLNADNELIKHLKGKSENINLNGTQKFIAQYEKIEPLYNLCISEDIFKKDFTLMEFTRCFQLPICKPKFPTFNDRPKFVFILSQIEFVNEKIALEHFGIKGYKTQKGREIYKRVNISSRNKLFNFTNNVVRIINS